MQRFRFVIAGWLLLLLMAPGVAWVLGQRQPVLENRAKAEFPAINRSSLPNPQTYPRLEAAILDRLPFRGRALEVRGRLSVQVFGDSTNPLVVLGRDGWLFYAPDTRECTDEGRPETDPADALDVMARAIVASGRRGGVLLAGAKTVAMREFRKPGDLPEVDCARSMERRVQARLRVAPGGLDIQEELDARRARGIATFLKNDTHWTPDSRLVFLRAILERAQPGLADRAELTLDPVPVDYPGDLGRFLAIPKTEPVRWITAAKLRGAAPGRIAFIGDSQMDFSLNQPATDGTTVVGNALPGSPVCHVLGIAAGTCDTVIRESRSLVIEVVARNLKEVSASCWRPVSIVSERSHGRPVRWQRNGARTSELRFGGSGEQVTLAAGRDVSSVPRLYRLPIERFPSQRDGAPPNQVELSQTPRPGTLPVPCATPSQAVEGGALFLPVPAGRAVSEVALQLEAPKGTVLGAPEEIVLDGSRAPQR